MSNPLLSFGLPPDAVAWATLCATPLALLVAIRRPERLAQLVERRPHVLVGVLAATAALLSAGYIAFYLRGGPRIVDATSYLLEARTLAAGQLAFAVPEPSGSFRGRFLVNAPDGRLAVLFPPGYPALLALGVLARAPLLIGPAIGAALVYTTWALARRVIGRDDVALWAAVLSTLSAALRYHTADTMAHGFSALLLSLALLFCWREKALSWRQGIGFGAAAGLCIGWLAATRPLSGLVGLALSGAVMATRARRLLPGFALGLLPGLAFFAFYQHAATGEWFGSAQLRYYALADGPPGCFHLGFGTGIGCLHEHGDFVQARLLRGYGVTEALLGVLRRLQHHVLDIANAEPFALLVPFAAWAGFKLPGVRVLSAGAILIVVAHMAFYFDATYPGGGARLYTDVLPLEHVLVAFGLVKLGLARYAPALMFFGFAVHASFSHRALADREGGRPMLEPRVIANHGLTRGLLFVSTDNGFNLGHDPSVRDADRGLVVARSRSDAHDYFLWERLGRPSTYWYRYDPFEKTSTPRIEPRTILPGSQHRFEGEAEWPVLAIEGGFAHPDFAPGDCVSGGQVLRLRRTTEGPLVATLEVMARGVPMDVVAQWVALEPGDLQVELRVLRSSAAVRAQRTATRGECWQTRIQWTELTGGANPISAILRHGIDVGLDWIEVVPTLDPSLLKRR